MIHKTRKLKSNIVMMWYNHLSKKEQEIKFVAKNGTKVSEGDAIDVGSEETPGFYVLHEIIECRPSNVSGYQYITATAIRQRGYKEEQP